MKRRLFVSLFIAALVLALGTIAAACGGGGALSLQEYFQKLDAVQNDAAARSEALGQPAQELQALRDFSDEATALFSEVKGSLDDLEPPGEAQDAHKEMVAAFTEQLGLFRDLADKLADAKSLSEVQEELANLVTELDSVGERMEETCLALQQIADDEGIDVDLECGE